MICWSCEFYDSSTDACNADDKCYTQGYQRGYKKGYADGSLSVTSELIEHSEAYQQGRADAIDECKEKMKIAFIDVMRCYECVEGALYPTSWIDDVLEQLKEQKNE